MNLSEKMTSIKGIGAKTAERLTRMGIITVGDFLAHYPRDYHRYEIPVSIADTSFDNRQAAAYRVHLIEPATLVKRGKTTVVSLTVREREHAIQVVWYHSPYIRQQLNLGDTLIFYGKIISKGRRRVLEHPDIYMETQYKAMQMSLQPIYGLTEGLSQNFFMKTMHLLLDEESLLKDYLPSNIRKKYQLSEYNYAVEQIHFPKDDENYQMARKRLVFDEFLIFALAMKTLKKENHKIVSHYQISANKQVDEFIDSLPYQLTNAQLRVWHEIAEGMAGEMVMNRLVQGDVGSGKTMIAALSMYAAAMSGFQSCMMAPTEVLARQHYENLSSMFEPFGIKVGLLTGSMTAAQKRKAYKQIEQQDVDIIIGTQALFQEKAVYKNLALIITDEQHRFGVRQRESLALKSGAFEPHVLVMSATPIPRTLAIILYSDLDISVVDEKPANRLPIKNCVVGTSYRPTAYHFLENQVRGGHQVYVICPMVEESETIEAENVQDYTQKLKHALPADISISFLHGKMKPDEKNHIMEDFSSRKIDILVSTTVIEVGVDVPNATVMMIENAERFGLAQLHQLRGRVGRGDAQSYCIFIYSQDNQKVKERLNIMLHTNDGFKIASEDLKLRGPGDMFGIRQSGSMVFKIGDIFADSNTLLEAGRAADEIILDNEWLEKEEYMDLRQKMEHYISDHQQQIIL